MEEVGGALFFYFPIATEFTFSEEKATCRLAV
jgi:hypothetical protein